jgi:hypothetical protein
MINDKQNSQIEYIKERACKMYLAGNEPSPQWWIDRIIDILSDPSNFETPIK